MKKTSVAKYLAEIGRKGGKKSKRKLTKKEARRMAKRRWGRRVALVSIVAIILGVACGTMHAQMYPDGYDWYPKPAFQYYFVNFLPNADLPPDCVEVANLQMDGARFYVEQPKERPAGLPATFILVRVFAHPGEEKHLVFVGWFWLDAKQVNILHELDRPVEAPRVSL